MDIPDFLSRAWALSDWLRLRGFSPDEVCVGVARALPGASPDAVFSGNPAKDFVHVVRIEVGVRGHSCGFSLDEWPAEPGEFPLVWGAVEKQAQDLAAAVAWRVQHAEWMDNHESVIVSKLESYGIKPKGYP